VYTADELRSRLAGDRPLRVKLGVDPTAPDIHLGHTLALSKLRKFQDLGHQAILIIGDFTARIGDPSGRSATRPQLEAAQIEANAATYLEQIFKVLIRERTEIHRNSEWFADFPLDRLIRLVGQVTVARMLERDDFEKRYRAGEPIGLHEFLYPVMQGYDSVMVRSDVELGGTDQTFNLLMGRDLQRAAGQIGQVALVLPLLEGLDGTHKMSKSLGNHIGIADAPEDMFGKVMSVSDPLMLRYYALLSERPPAFIEEIRTGAIHPMEAKKGLAHEVVARFHGADGADRASKFFAERFQRREANDPTPVEITTSSVEMPIGELLRQLGFASSNADAKRLLAQGAVRVDGEPVALDFRFRGGHHRLLAVGRKRLAAVTFRAPDAR
jgi:tyrosyl-tRNA synthetase